MSASLPAVRDAQSPAASGKQGGRLHNDFVTVRLADQLFGIKVYSVQDVLRGQKIARVPLAPPEIAGSMNLRGRIVTVINLRQRLGLPVVEYTPKTMSVVVEHDEELYSLWVDSVGDVLSLSMQDIEKPPANLPVQWRDVASGIFKLKDELMVIMDVAAVLDIGKE